MHKNPQFLEFSYSILQFLSFNPTKKKKKKKKEEKVKKIHVNKTCPQFSRERTRRIAGKCRVESNEAGMKIGRSSTDDGKKENQSIKWRAECGAVKLGLVTSRKRRVRRRGVSHAEVISCFSLFPAARNASNASAR